MDTPSTANTSHRMRTSAHTLNMPGIALISVTSTTCTKNNTESRVTGGEGGGGYGPYRHWWARHTQATHACHLRSNHASITISSNYNQLD